MNDFSPRSQKKLEAVHPALRRLFRIVLKHMDCAILEGHRIKELQDIYFDSKKSKLEWPNSKHNQTPSLAVDVAPYPINWKDEKRFYYFAGIVKGVASQMNINIRWGGDWDGDTDLNDQTFFDLVHFELVGDEYVEDTQ